MHGQGLYTYVNGDMYTGAFEHGSKHGQGSYYFKVNLYVTCALSYISNKIFWQIKFSSCM